LRKTIAEIENRTTTKVDAAIKASLEALTEIRDNAVHFVVATAQLAKQILEVGSAAVRNVVELARLWFRPVNSMSPGPVYCRARPIADLRTAPYGRIVVRVKLIGRYKRK
jgi:hypothetical protein